MKEQARLALERLDETPSGKRALRVWLRLLTTTRLVEKEVRGRFREHFGTTLPRFDVLAALDRAAPRALSMSELSRRLMVSNGNVTGVVQRLEDEGLVSRTRWSKDRRTQFVKLSKRGAEEFRELARAHERWIEELFAGLGHRDMQRLQRLLERTKRSLAGEPPPARNRHGKT